MIHDLREEMLKWVEMVEIELKEEMTPHLTALTPSENLKI